MKMKGWSKGFGWKKGDEAVVSRSGRKVKVQENKKDDFVIVVDEDGNQVTVYGGVLEKKND